MQFLSDEQQQLLHNYILLPLVLHVFQRDMKFIAESAIKTKGTYLKLMEAVIQRVENDLIQVRKEMRKVGVKVYEEQKTEDGIRVKYFTNEDSPSFFCSISKIEKSANAQFR